MNVTLPDARKLHDEIEGAVVILEHLAVQAAYAQEPCAQILLRTAELLRITVLAKG
ncbi:hypothetical protein IBL26_22100 [Roseomonas aerophila]|uniref:Uncharacterized protein n=1 Tax=Teichococcus aerophilus TaxID=1224513 RepID=A0ABR7RSK3_9PROT|nr:hypothetical protein [Pseudoroseomonas aerophila]MBC9209552.1 hypothetical protein [Pseudoroseomonas aerophila]